MRRARRRPRLLIWTAAAIAFAAAATATGPQPARGAVSECAARSYDPASQPPFGGDPVPPLQAVQGGEPRAFGFRLEPREAIAIAAETGVVEAELTETPGAQPRAFTQGPCRWQVSYFEGGEEVARVAIDDRSGSVLEAWRDHQVGSELARGYDGAVGRAVNSAYVWIPLCVLFVLPFFDPRRPLRALHIDLLVIVSLSVSLLFFNRGEITTSVPLTYPVLLYVLARSLSAGLRPREGRGALVPRIPVRWLAIGAVLLAAGRIGLNLADSTVIDIGVAGVIGADRITDGAPLYEGGFAPGIDLRGDVYGPANYLAYLPFEAVFGWDGAWDDVPAAHAAAIAFDLFAALGLLVLGRRLGQGREGRVLGVALAFAWLACPFTLYALAANANDALIAALLVWALVAIGSAPARGALVALAAAAKFGPAALAPLLAVGTGSRRWRSALYFSLAFVGVAAAVIIPFLPDGGLGEAYDRTLGYQASRSSPFSVWGLAPSLDFLQPVVRAAAVILAIAVALWPARKTTAQLAALAAAVIVAVQLGAGHWFYFYVTWFLPLFLVAAFAAHRPAPAPRTPSTWPPRLPRRHAPAQPAK